MTAHSGQPERTGTMPFGQHLEELRRRVLLAAAPAIPLAIVFYFFSGFIIKAMVLPLRKVLEDRGLPPEIQALTPPEVLVTQLKLSLIFAAVVLGPWILWQMWLFIRPGLYQTERRFVHLLIPGSVVLTAAGVALLYYVMLPLMLQVLVSVGSELDLGQGRPKMDPRAETLLEAGGPVSIYPLEADRDGPPPAPGSESGLFLIWPEMTLWAAVPIEGAAEVAAGPAPRTTAETAPTLEVVPVPKPVPGRVVQAYRLSTYVNFVLLLLVGVVVAFQMPLVILLLGWVGLADAKWLAGNRRYALLVCGILSAMLTPADVVSMLVLLIPLYMLYELGIVLLRVVPADAVARGRIAGLRLPGAGGAANNDSPDKQPTPQGQVVEPAQSAGSVARTDAGPDDSEDPDDHATD